MNRKTLLGAAAGLLVATALAVPAFAADPTATPTPRAGCVGNGPMEPGQGAMGGWMGALGIDDTLARLTKLTDEQIHTERLAGKSLAQIAQANGVSEDVLIAEVMKDRKAALDARLKAGTLTQAQADQMLANMQASVKAAVERTDVGPMGAVMMGGRGGRWQQQGAQGQGMGPRQGP
jgi:hypothetical protein